MRLRRWMAVPVIAVTALVGTSMAVAATDGQQLPGWTVGYAGYGSVTEQVFLRPQAAASPAETHAALALSQGTYSNVDFTVKVKTTRQIRRNSAPNPWEVGWLTWHYTDDSHFYSLVLKPNGWELGKEDPAYPGAQRYLITRSMPQFPVNRWYTVHVSQVGNHIQAWVNGTKLANYHDTRSPYTGSGRVGLYCEDSYVTFEPVSIRSA